MALDTIRCFFADTPVLRRGKILPRSLINRFKKSMSLWSRTFIWSMVSGHGRFLRRLNCFEESFVLNWVATGFPPKICYTKSKLGTDCLFDWGKSWPRSSICMVSATISALILFSPSLSYESICNRPSMAISFPFFKYWLHISASRRHATTRIKSADWFSCFGILSTAILNLQRATPEGVSLKSGSRTNRPIRNDLFMVVLSY